MKKKLYLLLIHIFLFVITAAVLPADTIKAIETKEAGYAEKEYKRLYGNREHIKNMIIDIQINKDGTLTVNEKIDYYFPAKSYKHGIFREIPVSYPGGAKEDIRIKMNYIKRSDQKEPYKTTKKSGIINFKIGNAKTYVSGMNTYVLNYTVNNAVVKNKENKYELDWNAVGQNWSCDILNSEINIFFEGHEKVFSKYTNLKIYSGSLGGKGKDFRYTVDQNIIKISTTKILKMRNGLSFFLSFNSDEIQISTVKKLENFIFKNRLLSFSVIFLLLFWIFMFFRLLTIKKNPEIDEEMYGKTSNDLSPMFAAYLNNNIKIDIVISVGILTLISKNHMRLLPEAGEDAFELLDSKEKLTEEEKELKDVLGKQLFEQKDIETIVENKIKEILKQEEKNSADSEKTEELKKLFNINTGKSGLINRFSNIKKDSFYAFQANLTKLLLEKKIKMTVKDNFSIVFALLLIGLVVFSEYIAVFTLTENVGASIVISINSGIWSIVGLIKFILGKPLKRAWIWGVVIGVLLLTATRNIFILPVWCIFGFSYSKYVQLKYRNTEYGVKINNELKDIRHLTENYESRMKSMLSTEEMKNYMGKMYPYMIALKIVKNEQKLADVVNLNAYVLHDEINNSFQNTYRYNNIRNHVKNSYSSAVSSKSSSGSSGGSHSSSGGGHGGGGGGSW